MKGIIKLNKTALKLLMMLWQMPYACAEDLKLWPMVSAGRVYPTLCNLADRKLIGYESLGWVRDAQRRFYLRHEGVELVMQRTGWPSHWAVTDKGRRTIRSFGPMMECLYHAAPRFWRPGWVLESIPHYDYWEWLSVLDDVGPDDRDESQPRVPTDVSPDSFTWLREGPLHALVGMQPGPDEGHFWVPLVWYGTHAPKPRLPDAGTQLFAHLETEPNPVSGLRPLAPGVVIVAQDFLAAARAARENPRVLSRLILTYETQTGEIAGSRLQTASGPKTKPAKKSRFRTADSESSLEIDFPHGWGRVVEANPSLSR